MLGRLLRQPQVRRVWGLDRVCSLKEKENRGRDHLLFPELGLYSAVGRIIGRKSCNCPREGLLEGQVIVLSP